MRSARTREGRVQCWTGRVEQRGRKCGCRPPFPGRRIDWARCALMSASQLPGAMYLSWRICHERSTPFCYVSAWPGRSAYGVTLSRFLGGCVRALVVWVDLDLVDRGLGLGVAEELAQVTLAKVGHADFGDEPLRLKRLECRPRAAPEVGVDRIVLRAALLEEPRPVDENEVDAREAEVVGRLADG